jgi:hypothetical protein
MPDDEPSDRPKPRRDKGLQERSVMMKTRLQELEDEVQAAEALSQEDREREYGTQGLGLLKAEVARLKWNDASAFYANVYEIWKECTGMTVQELWSKYVNSVTNVAATVTPSSTGAKTGN